MAIDQQVLNKLLEYLELMISQLKEKSLTIQKLEEDYDLYYS